MFRLDKILSDLTKLQRGRDKKSASPLGSPIFLSGDFIALSCLFSVTKSISTFQRAYRYSIMLIQKRAKMKRTSMQQAWTEKISLAFRNKISIFSGFKEQLALGRTCHYMVLLTDEQEQRGSSFNYYGSQIFPNQIINEEQSSRSISSKLTSSFADASSAAAQNKEQYEALKKRRSDARS